MWNKKERNTAGTGVYYECRQRKGSNSKPTWLRKKKRERELPFLLSF